jgi:hypothetical protein
MQEAHWGEMGYAQTTFDALAVGSMEDPCLQDWGAVIGWDGCCHEGWDGMGWDGHGDGWGKMGDRME